MSREHEVLGQRHHLYSPPLSALAAVLDKRRLTGLAAEVGLATPASWHPRDEAEALRLAPDLPFQVPLKPRTQVLLRSRSKGIRVAAPEELQGAWRAALASLCYAPSLVARIPDIGVPMVQADHADRADGIVTISGFVDESHRHFLARASRKVLQSPRGLGVGLGFEAIPVDPRLADGIHRLCARAGYFGVFDVEFLDGTEPLLIDLNPRLYNQVSFEMARGLPSPWLAYLGAIGDQDGLANAVAAAIQPDDAPTI